MILFNVKETFGKIARVNLQILRSIEGYRKPLDQMILVHIYPMMTEIEPYCSEVFALFQIQ